MNVLPTIDVVAALLECKQTGEVLFSQRPQGKVRAGLWELPGGKIEHGETAIEALLRELREELGVVAACPVPLFVQRHAYPDLAVRLHVFRACHERNTVRPDPASSAAVVWSTLSAAESELSLSDADRRVLKRLRLPRQLAISADCLPGKEQIWLAEMRRSLSVLRPGWLLLRTPGLSRESARSLALALREHAEATIEISIAADIEFALAEGFGLHLKASQLRDPLLGPGLKGVLDRADREPWFGASAHDAAELELAQSLGCDYATLSPVLPTLSHPGAEAMGWTRFGSIARGAWLPVFALGGMTPELMGLARDHGAHGIAGIRSFW